MCKKKIYNKMFTVETKSNPNAKDTVEQDTTSSRMHQFEKPDTIKQFLMQKVNIDVNPLNSTKLKFRISFSMSLVVLVMKISKLCQMKPSMSNQS